MQPNITRLTKMYCHFPIDLDPSETPCGSNSIGEWYAAQYHPINKNQNFTSPCVHFLYKPSDFLIGKKKEFLRVQKHWREYVQLEVFMDFHENTLFPHGWSIKTPFSLMDDQ